MLKALTVIERFIRTMLGVVVVGILGVGGWLGYQFVNHDKLELQKTQQELDARRLELAAKTADVERLTKVVEVRDQEIGELEHDVQVKAVQIEKLDTAIRFLKIDQRVARIEVLDQKGSAKDNDLVTTFSFQEVNAQDQPIDSPRVFKIKGDLVYIDAWVVKFDDQLVETGVPGHATSVYLFRRIFGESQQPKDGFVLDPVGSSPAAYRSRPDMTGFERNLWAKFWDYANDANLAHKEGIRAAHGEAPSMKLISGKAYRVTLRASDGLSIIPEEKTAEKPGKAT